MVTSQFSLDGSVALVTGGSRGIGAAIARAMAEAGAEVMPAARSRDDLDETVAAIEADGGRAAACRLDVTDGASVEAAFDAAEATLGPVDVLVNNAGTNPFFGDAVELDLDVWDHILAVNLTGAFRCAQAFARRREAAPRGGAVVNVASIGGLVGLANQAPYTASKHGLVGLTRALALEWATDDIRANAIAPGYVKTALTAGVRGNDRIREELLSRVAQERFAEPAEVAGAAVYLASDAASYVTGEVHVVDGGYVAE